MGARELRIRRDRAFETGLCKRRVGSRETVEMAEAEMIVCPGIQPVRVAQPRDARLVERYVGLEGGDEMHQDPRPQIAKFVYGGYDPVRPEDFPGPCVGHLHNDRDSALIVFDGARQDVAGRKGGRHTI